MTALDDTRTFVAATDQALRRRSSPTGETGAGAATPPAPATPAAARFVGRIRLIGDRCIARGILIASVASFGFWAIVIMVGVALLPS